MEFASSSLEAKPAKSSRRSFAALLKLKYACRARSITSDSLSGDPAAAFLTIAARCSLMLIVISVLAIAHPKPFEPSHVQPRAPPKWPTSRNLPQIQQVVSANFQEVGGKGAARYGQLPGSCRRVGPPQSPTSWKMARFGTVLDPKAGPESRTRRLDVKPGLGPCLWGRVPPPRTGVRFSP